MSAWAAAARLRAAASASVWMLKSAPPGLRYDLFGLPARRPADLIGTGGRIRADTLGLILNVVEQHEQRSQFSGRLRAAVRRHTGPGRRTRRTRGTEALQEIAPLRHRTSSGPRHYGPEATGTVLDCVEAGRCRHARTGAPVHEWPVP